MSIKLENVVLASPEQMEFIIQGMRNPMNSWEKKTYVRISMWPQKEQKKLLEKIEELKVKS